MASAPLFFDKAAKLLHYIKIAVCVVKVPLPLFIVQHHQAPAPQGANDVRSFSHVRGLAASFGVGVGARQRGAARVAAADAVEGGLLRHLRPVAFRAGRGAEAAVAVVAARLAGRGARRRRVGGGSGSGRRQICCAAASDGPCGRRPRRRRRVCVCARRRRRQRPGRARQAAALAAAVPAAVRCAAGRGGAVRAAPLVFFLCLVHRTARAASSPQAAGCTRQRTWRGRCFSLAASTPRRCARMHARCGARCAPAAAAAAAAAARRRRLRPPPRPRARASRAWG
jgi:hypothetical protein